MEAVIDKDLTAALLGRQLRADALLLTDVPAVQDGDGTPLARAIRLVTPAALRARKFPAVSMGPKLEAACRFVEATGKMAAIGQLADAQALLARQAGTVITAKRSGDRPVQACPRSCSLRRSVNESKTAA